MAQSDTAPKETIHDSLHFGNPSSDIHFPLNSQIFKSLISKPVLPKRLLTTRYGAWCRTMTEYSVHTAFAHLVVTFRINHKAHIWIEITRGFADGADV
jgi:hypothetical protein